MRIAGAIYNIRTSRLSDCCVWQCSVTVISRAEEYKALSQSNSQTQ